MHRDKTMHRYDVESCPFQTLLVETMESLNTVSHFEEMLLLGHAWILHTVRSVLRIFIVFKIHNTASNAPDLQVADEPRYRFVTHLGAALSRGASHASTRLERSFSSPGCCRRRCATGAAVFVGASWG